jgi:multidrug resistance efflux pump
VVDGAQSKVSATQAQLDQARNATAFQVLRADADGVVVGVEAEAGQVVAAGQPVIRVALVKDRDVVVNVPEKDMELARRIDRWQVSLPATGGKPVPARIRRYRRADPASEPTRSAWTLLAEVPGAEWA